MSKTKDNNIHSGHRDRLINTIVESGLENVNEIQAVEFLCTFIKPMQDVNPLAHELLKNFGSFVNILNADAESLATVKGMTMLGSKKLSLFKEILKLYNRDKRSNTLCLKNMKAIYNYLNAMLCYDEPEQSLLIGLDKNDKVIAEERITNHLNDKVVLPIKKVANFVAKYNIDSFIMCHNHPNGDARPSQADISSTQTIQSYCAMVGVKFLDHIIMGKDIIYSFQKCQNISVSDILGEGVC